MESQTQSIRAIETHHKSEAVLVRRCCPEDVPAVVAINGSSLAERVSEKACRIAMRRFSQGFLVAERNGKVVGYVLSRINRYPSLRALHMVQMGHIVSIAVSMESRGIGAGQALLRGAMDIMLSTGVRGIYLEVRENNGAARRLYEKLGFESTMRMKGYYGKGADGIEYVFPARMAS